MPIAGSVSVPSRSNNMYSSWYDDLLTRFANKEFQEPYFIFIHFFELHQPRLLAKEYNTANFGDNKYERALSSLDAQLGKLLNLVDDKTLIILHGDHGEKFAGFALFLEEAGLGNQQGLPR